MKIAIVSLGWTKITVPVAQLSAFLAMTEKSHVVDDRWSENQTLYIKAERRSEIEVRIVDDSRLVSETEFEAREKAAAEAREKAETEPAAD